MTADSTPWTTAEFRLHLEQLGDARYHHRHPFNQRLHRGQVSRAELELWVANRFCYQEAIPRKDAAILANCPERDVRRRWIERILDHDGRGPSAGGLEAWLRLGEAIGVDRATLQSGCRVVPGVRFAVEAYVTFCRTRPWLEAVASSLTELFAPTLMADRLTAFETHYPWIEPAGLQYFRDRLRQAPRDAEYAVALVLERATSRSAQEQALAALAFKCDVLWSLLDAVQAGPVPWTSP